MDDRSNDRLEQFIAHPKRAVWVIAAPMMVGFTVHALYAIVDSIFIGRLGTDALAASGYIGNIFTVAIALTSGLATGVTAAVATAYGRRDLKQLSHLASNGLSMGILIGCVLGALGLLYGQDIIPLLGATGESAELAWSYMMPLWVGMPLFFISTAIRSVLNGEGDATAPMIIMGISTLLNLGFDPVFIFVLGYGIRGAAYATIIAQGFTLVALIYIAFIKKRITAKFRIRLMAPVKSLVGQIVRIGLPAAIGLLVMAAGMVFVYRIISEFSQFAVAGYVAGSRIDMFVALPLLGLAAASVTVVGMFAGARRPDLIRITALYTYKWSVLASIVLGVVAFLFADSVVGWFVKEPQAKAVGVTYVGYMIFAYPLMAIGMTSGRILQGLGYGMPSLIITSLRVLVLGVAGSYICVYWLDLPIDAIWLSFVAGGFCAAILSIFWIRKYLWKQDPSAARISSS